MYLFTLTLVSSAALRNQWRRIWKSGSSLPPMTARCRRWTLSCAPHTCSWTLSRQRKFWTVFQPQLLCLEITYIKPAYLYILPPYTGVTHVLLTVFHILRHETGLFFIPTDWPVFRRNWVRQRANQQPICWPVRMKYYNWKQSSWSPLLLLS